MDAHVPALRAREGGLFDAIVTDPPYGVRAGGRRSLCLSETGVASKTGQQRAQVCTVVITRNLKLIDLSPI